ncbi:MAG: Crp/Fnr family transcriptional regulator [Burkholderiales bacterium]
MPDARTELLQQMAIFGGIRTDILLFLLERANVVRVDADAYFFREGDFAQSMFVLETGRAAVLKLWRGEQHPLRTIEAGDCFGEMALMDMKSRSASVLAIEACTAIELSAGCLFELYERDLEQFALIQMNMGREVSRRLRETDDRLFESTMGSPCVDASHLLRAI